MRRRLSFLLASAAAMLAASAVTAGTLDSAVWYQVTQGVPMTRSFNAGGVCDPDGAGPTPPGACDPLIINSSTSSATSVAVNLSFPDFTTQFFVPKTTNGTLDLNIFISQGGPQAIVATKTPLQANGTPGVEGTVVVMTAKHVVMGLNQSMFNVGVNTLVKVPLSAGKAGLFTGTFTVVGAPHTITVDFYAWTPGTLVFNGLTSKGAPLDEPTVVAMGSFNLNSQGGGAVTLVSPSKVDIDGSLAQRRTASFTKLTLAFIPEPGAVLLILGGVLGLGVMGRFRR
jgi:hypothetical protein